MAASDDAAILRDFAHAVRCATIRLGTLIKFSHLYEQAVDDDLIEDLKEVHRGLREAWETADKLRFAEIDAIRAAERHRFLEAAE